MTVRAQRQTKTERFVFNESGDVTTYAPGLLKFTVGLYPALGSGYPDLPALELPLRSIFKEAPQRNPITSVFRQKREINNAVHVAYAIHFDPILPTLEGEDPGGPQMYSVILNPSGEVVFQMQSPFHEAQGSDFVDFIFDSYHFEQNSKKVPASGIKTIVEPVNEDAMTHHFQASVVAPGFGEFKHRGEVADLKKRGILPGKQDFFKEAHVWKIGNDVALIIEDSNKHFHTSVLTNGNPGQAQKTVQFKTALANARRQLNAN